MMRVFLFLLILMMPVPVVAQEQGDFAQRLALAEKMLEIRPAKDQLESAVNSYISNYMFGATDVDQQAFRTVMLSIMNPKALEKVAVDAYAETFTRAELEAMVAYYSKPEAKSAGDKQGELERKIGPQIMEMLDRAMMKVRTMSKAP